jgi:predicted phosphate transport protein (TIGR00153 family)
MDETVRRQKRFIRKVVSLSSAGVFLDGYDLFIISVALIFVEAQNWLSSTPSLKSFQLGLLSSSALMGMFVGALFVGGFADRIGRRSIYVIDLVFFVFFGLLTALATNINQLILFRFLLGIGIGADYPVSSTYVAEFSPKNIRGKLVTRTFLFWGIGSLVAAFIGFTFGRFEFISILGYHVDSWRIMLASGVVPALIVLVLRRAMPESPRWLMTNNQREKAEKIIEEIKEKYSLDYTKDLSAIEPERRGKISELLGQTYRRRTLFSWIPWFFMDIGVYGVGISIPYMLVTIGFKGNTLIDRVNSILGTIFLDVFIVVGFIVAILVIERIGRIRLQELGFIGMALAALSLAIGYSYGLMVIIGALAFYLFFENAGPNVTTWVIPTEIFPTRLRATAQGSSSAVSRLGAVLGTFTFPVFVFLYGWSLTFLAISIFMFIGLAFTMILGTEPKGLALEDSSIVFLEFSKYLQALAEKVKEAAVQLNEMVSKYDNMEERAEKIMSLEHEADQIVHEIYTRVNHMSKPLESVDVGMLATKYDDILDFINAVAKRLTLFRVDKGEEMQGFADVILKSVIEVNKALKYFGNFDQTDFAAIIDECVTINKLENEGDDLLAKAYGTIFKLKDPVEIIKLKEIYEFMETVTDKCEDVSDIFRDLVIKYS